MRTLCPNPRACVYTSKLQKELSGGHLIIEAYLKNAYRDDEGSDETASRLTARLT